MGHGTDRGHVLQQLHVRGGRSKRVVADDRAHRLAAKLTVLGGIDVLVEPALGDVGRKLEVLQQLCLGGVQHIHLDVFPEIGAIDHQFQAAPGRLQFLELGRVEDLIHLCADLAIQLHHHLVHQGLVDRLAFLIALQQVGNKRGHPAGAPRHSPHRPVPCGCWP